MIIIQDTVRAAFLPDPKNPAQREEGNVRLMSDEEGNNYIPLRTTHSMRSYELIRVSNEGLPLYLAETSGPRAVEKGKARKCI